ncbi:hypothetical protein DFP72DRAFT_1054672 [Ephemerocybe angulata]|uniref:DUF6533 domain-containing protein n=1 Tax=Ephemerocybe angulata TaxID=980116 RepID=A0A8H6H913_9AGAR|nr:hypothetical protein DFP72DRAFT_1054672 [Tulosesus angulatus]
MDPSPEDLAELSSTVSIWIAQDYISLGFYCFYGYYYLTTLGEEISTMWPQRWRTGKILFLLLRYTVIAYSILGLLNELRVQTVFSLEVCSALWMGKAVLYRIYSFASDLVLILCLHALLGAKRRYLALLVASLTAFTLGEIIPQAAYIEQGSRASPIDPLDEGLGYACTYGWAFTAEARRGDKVAIYLAVGQAAWMSALAVTILYVRFRQTRGGALTKILWRDGGLYFLSVTAIRLGISITVALKPRKYNIPNAINSGLQTVVIPVLACRLLLNMRKSEDPGVCTAVSSLLFDPPSVTSGDSETGSSEDSTSDREGEVGHYAGLGRRRGARKEKEAIEAGVEPLEKNREVV